MKCPLSYRETTVSDGIECTQRSMECSLDCAWLVERGAANSCERYCAIAVIASSGTEPMGFCPVNSIEKSA